MVKVIFELNSTLSSHSNSVIINGVNYIDELEDANFHQVFDVDVNTNDLIEIIILTRPIIKNDSNSVNIIKKMIGALVMIVIDSISISIYDCDCWDYVTNIALSIEESNPKVNVYINEQSKQNKSLFKIDIEECNLIEKQTKSELNKQYFEILFSDYQKYNIIRTLIFSMIFILIFLIGIVTFNITTIIFSGSILLFFIFSYSYTKKQILNLKKYIERKE